jgi:hypothetical protein
MQFPHFAEMGSCDVAGNQAEIAFGSNGELFVELVQPTDNGYLYNHLLDRAPDGSACVFHHYAVRIPDVAAAQATIEREQRATAAAGTLGPDFWFAYLDFTATLGHFVELVWASPGGEAWWDELRQASAQARSLIP